MAIKPITGMLRRTFFMDLGVATVLGFGMGSAFWYGYHMPRTNARDRFYEKIEQERAANA